MLILCSDDVGVNVPRASFVVNCTIDGVELDYDYVMDTNLCTNYTIQGNIIVSYGYTLTIAAGVTLKFMSGRGIVVDGTLIVSGLQNSPVTMTSVGIV